MGFRTLLFRKLSPWRPNGVKPVEGATVADPGDQATMQVHGCPVDLLVCTRYGGIDGDDVLLHQKQVMEGDLDWFIPLGHDEPAQMGRLDVPAQSSGRGEAPQGRRAETVRRRHNLILELYDAHLVMGHTRDRRR